MYVAMYTHKYKISVASYIATDFKHKARFQRYVCILAVIFKDFISGISKESMQYIIIVTVLCSYNYLPYN